MARKRLSRVDYITITKTLDSLEYQQKVKEYLDANRSEKRLENHSVPASKMWKSVYVLLYEKYFDGTNQLSIREQADKMEIELLQDGFNPEEAYRGEV